jgi:hypothetical protein
VRRLAERDRRHLLGRRRPVFAFLAAPVLAGCSTIRGRATQTAPGGERAVVPLAYLAYQDHLEAIGARSIGPSDMAVVQGTVLSITPGEVCATPQPPASAEAGPCPMHTYPRDTGLVRIDRILGYSPYDQPGRPPAEQPAGQPAGAANDRATAPHPGAAVPGADGRSSPGAPGGGRRFPPLQEGDVVETLFLLTARVVKVRHIRVPAPAGGDEAGSQAAPRGPVVPPDDAARAGTATASERTATQVIPAARRAPRPIPQEGGGLVFTTRFGSGIAEIERTLPGLRPGDRFVAETRYAGVLYVEDYERLS